MSNKIIIMRGLPGSGKSTKAKTLEQAALSNDQTCKIISADDYFLNDKGKYVYKKTKQADAHRSCYSLVHSAVVSDRIQCVIIDNTNITLGEFDRYFQLHKYGYDVEIVDMHEDRRTKKGKKFPKAKIKELAERTTHEVPEKIIAKMASNYAWYEIQYKEGSFTEGEKIINWKRPEKVVRV